MPSRGEDSGSNPDGSIYFNSFLDGKNIQNGNHSHNSTQIHSHKNTDLSLTFTYLKEFFEWVDLQEYSYGHIIHLKSYYKKHLHNNSFENPLHLQKYIQNKQTGISSIVKTARTYLRYCGQTEKLTNELIGKYRTILKYKSSKMDFYVPTDEEVIKNYNILKRRRNYEIVYLVLMTSGIRYIECLEFLKNFEPNKFQIHPKYVSYSVSELRHTKNINNIYLPLFVYKKLIHVNNTYNCLRQKFKERGCTFSMKYLRKWHYNFMLFNNFPESVADFIQGRSSKSVSANHYLARSQQSAFWYSKIAHKFESLFKRNTKKSQNSTLRFQDTKKSNLRTKMEYSGGKQK